MDNMTDDRKFYVIRTQVSTGEESIEKICDEPSDAVSWANRLRGRDFVVEIYDDLGMWVASLGQVGARAQRSLSSNGETDETHCHMERTALVLCYRRRDGDRRGDQPRHDDRAVDLAASLISER